MAMDAMDLNLKMEFPAVRGMMGKRQYYAAMFPLRVVSKLFKFQDYAELPPEQRAQRVLNKKRVPEIARYILENEDGWLFSSLTASFNGEEKFDPINVKNHPNIGTLILPLETEFLINDGQHRRAAIEEALRENPTLGNETISVVLFPLEDLQRSQQMFSDLNRTVQKTSRSLDILYDQRDPLNEITLAVAESVPAFKGKVEKDKVSLAVRSPKFITLSSLYDANTALLGRVNEGVGADMVDELHDRAVEYWKSVTLNIPEWKLVAEGDLKPSEARQGYVHSSAVAFLSLGMVGRTLIERFPEPFDWKAKLAGLREINWARTNKEWQGICMIGTDIVARRQTREATTRFIEWKLGLREEAPEPVLPSIEAA